MSQLYNFSIFLLGVFMRLAAWVHPKARLWIAGRKNWESQLKKALASAQPNPWIWMHCASLGEFEQGRNLLEAIRKEYGDRYNILLSFYSPSGYEVRKNYSLANYVCYLPLDTPSNAKKWVNLIQPQLTIFVKYELWVNVLAALPKANLSSILISARVEKNSSFFTSPFASLYKKTFQNFTAIFTQDDVSATLIRSFSNHSSIQISGDTRYDRVASNRIDFEPLPLIESFIDDRICIIGGSTWPKGEELLFSAFDQLRDKHKICLILAPHEINDARIRQWERKYPHETVRYSAFDSSSKNSSILWIDNVGMLSRLYHYAGVAYVGGGWGTGLHNILEAAVFGCPIIIGPKHMAFPEAQAMIDIEGAFAVADSASFTVLVDRLLENHELRLEISRNNKDFIQKQVGATTQIMEWIDHAKLLIN